MSAPVSTKLDPSYTQATLRVGTQKYTVVSPQKRSGLALDAVYGSIVANTLEAIVKTALEKIKSPPKAIPGVTPAFVIRKELFHPSIQDYKTTSETEEKKAGQKKMRIATKLSGLSEEDITGCSKLAKSFALQFFSQDLYFYYSDPKENIEKWKLEMMVAGLNFLYDKLGMKKSEEEVAFKEEDLKAFGLTRETISVDPKELSCHRFALFTAKELQAKDLIFQNANANRALKQLFKYLGKWNYKNVSEPTVGDLVVYLKNETPDHVGVYLGSDLVHSKIGIANPYSHKHRLFAVEDKALFFRKPNFC